MDPRCSAGCTTHTRPPARQEFEKALHDAGRCIAITPSFGKGYSREGLALYHLGRYAEVG